MANKRAYSYTRVSTSMQIDGFSLDAQKVRMDNYARSLDIDIISEFSDEAKIVRMIYDLFINDNGMKKVADHLNDRGYRRILYKNNSLEVFTSDFVKRVLDNEVYMDKIAYRKRRTQKKKGTRNQYEMVKIDDYIVSDGVHKAIVSEDVWQKAHKKRKETGIASIKTHSLDHEHKLSGILKCPVCGDSMYGNINRKRKTDGSGCTNPQKLDQ